MLTVVAAHGPGAGAEVVIGMEICGGPPLGEESLEEDEVVVFGREQSPLACWT